jgi:hypothetical protein
MFTEIAVRLMDPVAARQFLNSQHVRPDGEIDKVLSGFDFNKPAYAHQFWPGDVLYQLIRLPSSRDPNPATGNWFGLTGVTASGVAVNDGLTGRRLASFKVILPFTALEGTAVKFRINLGSGIGGPGGMTQIFVPSRLYSHLESHGPVQRW